MTKAECGRGINKFGSDVPAYRKIGIDVALKSDASVEKIQRLIVLNLKDFPKLIRKSCPTYRYEDWVDVDQTQLPLLINAISPKKQAP